MKINNSSLQTTFTPNGLTPVTESPKIVQAYYDIRSERIPYLYDIALFQLDQIRYLHDHYKSKEAESFYIERSLHNLFLTTDYYKKQIAKIELALEEARDTNNYDKTYLTAKLIHETLGIKLGMALKASSDWERSIGGFKLMTMEIESTIEKFQLYLVATQKREASCKCIIS